MKAALWDAGVGIDWEFVMPAFGRRIDGPTGRRRNVRQTVVLAASAMTLDQSRTVLVEDVCSEGAKLRGRDLPGRGSQILFKLGAWEVFASVVWNGRDECGITSTTLSKTRALAASRRKLIGAP